MSTERVCHRALSGFHRTPQLGGDRQVRAVISGAVSTVVTSLQSRLMSSLRKTLTG